jgi:hypothetical protein
MQSSRQEQCSFRQRLLQAANDLAWRTRKVDSVGSLESEQSPDFGTTVILRTCSASGKEINCMTARPSRQKNHHSFA